MPAKKDKQKGTGMFSAMRNVMPGADLPEVKEAEKTEMPVRLVAQIEPKRGAGRRRVPEAQRAISRAHSFKPEVLQALDEYARDQHTTPSQVITQALHAMVPDDYWGDK